MGLVELRERDRIAAFCRRNAPLHVYALGDLDDFHWPHTRWFAWEEHGSIEQIVLLYDEVSPPVLLAVGDERLDGLEALLSEVAPALPDRVYGHITPSVIGSLRDFAPDGEPVTHLKMGVAERTLLVAESRYEVRALGPGDLPALTDLYAEAYPGTWFHRRMLETGRYVGIREGLGLVCVAGVHVYSPTWRVAALGNVATAPSRRGQGLAKAACSYLCRSLLDDGIETIGLNVRADNATAVGVYEQLGFTVVARYLETFLTRR